MKKVTKRQLRELKALAQMPNHKIDPSDIAEVKEWRGAVVGKFYRKRPPQKAVPPAAARGGGYDVRAVLPDADWAGKEEGHAKPDVCKRRGGKRSGREKEREGRLQTERGVRPGKKGRMAVPGSDKIFDGGDGFDSAASTEDGAIQRGGGTGEIQLARQRPILK